LFRSLPGHARSVLQETKNRKEFQSAARVLQQTFRAWRYEPSSLILPVLFFTSCDQTTLNLFVPVALSDFNLVCMCMPSYIHLGSPKWGRRPSESSDDDVPSYGPRYIGSFSSPRLWAAVSSVVGETTAEQTLEGTYFSYRQPTSHPTYQTACSIPNQSRPCPGAIQRSG